MKALRRLFGGKKSIFYEMDRTTGNIKFHNGIKTKLKADQNRILIVDDSKITVSLIRDNLVLNDYPESRLQTAYGGQQCIDTVLSTPTIGVVLLDMSMPEIDGYEAAKRIREGGFTGSIIAVTGMTSSDQMIKGFDSGINVLHPKPIDFNSLIGLIQNVFDSAEKIPDKKDDTGGDNST